MSFIQFATFNPYPSLKLEIFPMKKSQSPPPQKSYQQFKNRILRTLKRGRRDRVAPGIAANAHYPCRRRAVWGG